MNNWKKDNNGAREGAEADRLDALLAELREADPPAPGLVNDVMTQIRNTANPVAHRTTGDTRMAKKVLIGLSAAAAVLVAVFATTGWPPTLPGTEGTIGAAKRHQAQQMSPADVKLGDAATQEFLQSDVVARLMADYDTVNDKVHRSEMRLDLLTEEEEEGLRKQRSRLKDQIAAALRA